VQALADRIEVEVQGGLASRPLLSVPHIISDEASCYYHGYVLAEMSVHQTREHFLKDGGVIVDNPLVGSTLTDCYWKPGNSEQFLDLVKNLTGKPLTGDAWIEALQEDLPTLIAKEKEAYDDAIASTAVAAAADGGPGNSTGAVDLNMRVLIKDGDELIADSSGEAGFLGACATFEAYVTKRFPRA